MRVLTLGTFDLLHAGHIALLRRCKALAGDDPVIVGLNTDEFVARYKGNPPVITYADREACLEACRYVDAILPNDQTHGSAIDVVKAADPEVIAIGWDWRDRDYLAQLGIHPHEIDGVRIVYLPYTPGAAGPSSAIRARIEATPGLRARLAQGMAEP